MLRKAGLSVIEASDGSSALDFLRTHGDEIGILLLDITLPGASSSEVFKEARRLRPGMKIIVTSAYGEDAASANFRGKATASFGSLTNSPGLRSCFNTSFRDRVRSDRCVMCCFHS